MTEVTSAEASDTTFYDSPDTERPAGFGTPTDDISELPPSMRPPVGMCWLRCIWDVTFPRQRRRTLIFMTALALISALGTALCVGYHLGRRAGSKPSTWKRRTSRVALGRLAINLLVLMTARRIRQSFQPGRVFSDSGGIWGLRFIETLGLLRGSVARLRSY